MIFKASYRAPIKQHDVCVVGSGPVGISFAVEAARHGLRVLLLESGQERALAAAQNLSDAHIVDPARHDPMKIAVARRLGGTSNLWGARCLPFDSIDFVDRRPLVDATWPIEWSDIAPYFDRACELTASGRAVYRSPIEGLVPQSGDFELDALERWANIQAAQNVHREILRDSPSIEVRLGMTVVGLDFAENGTVEGIRIVRADGSRIRLPVERVVIAAGGLESTRLLLAAQREVPTRFGGPDGPLGRYYMAHITGMIADIVLDKKIDRQFNFHVDEYGSYVRRRFVPSQDLQLREGLLNTALWPVVPAISNPAHGSAILSSIYLALAWGPIGRLLIAEAIRKRHISNGPKAIGAHLRNLSTGIPEALAFSFDFFKSRYFSRERLPGFFLNSASRTYGLFYHAEQTPQPDSRVRLADDRDGTGLQRLFIDLRFCDADAASVVQTHDLFSDWLTCSGLGHIAWHHPPEDRVAAVMAQASHGTHQIGTIRMGHSSSNAVVDRNLATFDARNLYVVSTAVLPTSGQANPTFTAIALAARLAEHLSKISSC